MKVFALIGQSGTGKSYKAMWVSKKENIDLIIDDGLLIRGNKILAGKSAKKEKTKISSVKRAIFSDIEHKNDVIKAINNSKSDSILILGTSYKMVERISSVLELPGIHKIINISDISTPEDIKKAINTRLGEGKHVIPVPTFEIKKDFSGYFIDSLKIFDLRKKGKKKFLADKSIVRPTFSYLGEYFISNQVITSICKYEISNYNFVDQTLDIKVTENTNGININISISLLYGVYIPDKCKEIQLKLLKTIEHLTALNVLKVNIYVKKLTKKQGIL